MATEKQYTFFKGLYDEEAARQASLADRAKTYLSLITFYSAFILFVAEKLQPKTPLLKLVLIGMIGAMIVGFLLSLLSIRVAEYEAINSPRDILLGFGTTAPDDEDFFDDRIVDFTVACERNSLVNDRKATLLSWAGYLLLIGIALHSGYILLRIA